MAQATLQQTESKLVADLEALDAYMSQKQDHSNRQASLFLIRSSAGQLQ